MGDRGVVLDATRSKNASHESWVDLYATKGRLHCLPGLSFNMEVILVKSSIVPDRNICVDKPMVTSR